MRTFFVVLILSILPVEVWAQNQTITSFSKAKKQLKNIHKQDRKTFYCGCTFIEGNIGRLVLSPEKTQAYARIEWGMLFKLLNLVKFSAWTKGHKVCRYQGRSCKGRKCAEKTNRLSIMQSDLYNLQPAIGEVPAARIIPLANSKVKFVSLGLRYRN